MEKPDNIAHLGQITIEIIQIIQIVYRVYPLSVVLSCCVGSVYKLYRSNRRFSFQNVPIRTAPTQQHELDHTDRGGR